MIVAFHAILLMAGEIVNALREGQIAPTSVKACSVINVTNSMMSGTVFTGRDAQAKNLVIMLVSCCAKAPNVKSGVVMATTVMQLLVR